MHQLTYELKQLAEAHREGSYATQANRKAMLMMFGEQLVAAGYKKMHAGELKGSVANNRKQESFDSQTIDFPGYGFRVFPRKGNFATEPFSQLRITHEQPSPEQHTEHDRGEEWIAYAHVGGGGAAEIAGQHDGAEHSGLRYDIDDRADDLEKPDPERQAREITESREFLHDKNCLDQLHHAAEKQHQDR